MTEGEAEQVNPQKGRANREIGGPGVGTPADPWHSRGYLPHFEGPLTIQDVTFHLADSLPKSALEQMEVEIKCLPVNKQAIERRKRLDAWIDAGSGSCVLREPVIAEMVRNSLLHFAAQRYFLLAWVVMPNHVHVLFEPKEGWTVGKIVASWKKFTARRICEHLRSAGRNRIGSIGGGDDANREIGGPRGAIWHREYWDRYIRNEFHLRQKVEYIHQNPVKAKLSLRAEDWPWSSAYPGTANLPIGSTEMPPFRLTQT
jgi:REP element-mobilizing transposase RayT